MTHERICSSITEMKNRLYTTNADLLDLRCTYHDERNYRAVVMVDEALTNVGIAIRKLATLAALEPRPSAQLGVAGAHVASAAHQFSARDSVHH